MFCHNYGQLQTEKSSRPLELSLLNVHHVKLVTLCFRRNLKLLISNSDSYELEYARFEVKDCLFNMITTSLYTFGLAVLHFDIAPLFIEPKQNIDLQSLFNDIHTPI